MEYGSAGELETSSEQGQERLRVDWRRIRLDGEVFTKGQRNMGWEHCRALQVSDSKGRKRV